MRDPHAILRKLNGLPGQQHNGQTTGPESVFLGWPPELARAWAAKLSELLTRDHGPHAAAFAAAAARFTRQQEHDQ